jgi:hypothetical protein
MAESDTINWSLKLWRKRWFRVLLALFVLFVLPKIISSISDIVTISDANPAMKQLTQDSGMSRSGELLFLRANPTFASPSEMSQNCRVISSDAGYIEQGCYDTQNNKIYIREFSTELYSVETVTAAHEMLHVAYMQSTKSSGTQEGSISSQIEKYYQTLTGGELVIRMANYQKSEPGAKDNELHSILGTEYAYLPTELETYYSRYFVNRVKVVTASSNASQVFAGDVAELKLIENEYNQDLAKADDAYKLGERAYYNSTTWAAVGDYYENDRNYNIYQADYNLYKQYFDQAKGKANQYEELRKQYNDLIAEYNGNPVTTQILVPTQQTVH